MRVFVDCEFTDFLACELISLALVADDGREFYCERSDYDPESCSEFVRAPAVGPASGAYALRAAMLGDFPALAIN